MPAVAAVGIFAGGAALATGTLTAFQTIAAIGSIVGGIGALTGNKALMTVGAVAGLAGGVGAFAQSQGWIASGAAGSALGDAANNTAALANAPSSVVENVAPTVETGAAAAPGASAAPAVVEAAGNAAVETPGVASATAQNIANASPMAAPDATGNGLYNAGAQEPVSSLAQPDTSVVGAGPAQAGQALSKAQLDGTNSFGANSAPGAFDMATDTRGSIFEKLGDFAKAIYKNPDGSLNKDMLSLTGNFIGGAFDEEKQARADYYETRADLDRQQAANANDLPDGRLRRAGQVTFRRTQPTYRAPRVGLMNAR